MRITVENQVEFLRIKKQEPVYISKDLINQAQEISSQNPQSQTVIYGEKVISIDSGNFQDLKADFRGDFSQHNGIIIAQGDAQAYLEKIVDFVMNDLNVKNADKDRDGNISMSESLYTKNTIIDGFIMKPIDFLDQESINKVKQDDTIAASIKEIIDENIEIDKDRDGKVTAKEVSSSCGVSGEDRAMKELYEKLSVVTKNIGRLMKQLDGADETTSALLNNQLQSFMQEQSGIVSQIKKVLEARRKQVIDV